MKLGDLDNKINERLEQDRNLLSQAVTSELQTLRLSLSALISDVLITTEAVIRNRSEALNKNVLSEVNVIESRCRLLSKTMFKAWVGLCLLGMASVVGVFTGTWFLTSNAADDLKTMQQELVELMITKTEQEHTLKALEKTTWGVRFYEDKNGRFLVLPKGMTPHTGWTLDKKTAIKLE